MHVFTAFRFPGEKWDDFMRYRASLGRKLRSPRSPMGRVENLYITCSDFGVRGVDISEEQLSQAIEIQDRIAAQYAPFTVSMGDHFHFPGDPKLCIEIKDDDDMLCHLVRDLRAELADVQIPTKHIPEFRAHLEIHRPPDNRAPNPSSLPYIPEGSILLEEFGLYQWHGKASNKSYRMLHNSPLWTP